MAYGPKNMQLGNVPLHYHFSETTAGSEDEGEEPPVKLKETTHLQLLGPTGTQLDMHGLGPAGTQLEIPETLPDEVLSSPSGTLMQLHELPAFRCEVGPARAKHAIPDRWLEETPSMLAPENQVLDSNGKSLEVLGSDQVTPFDLFFHLSPHAVMSSE